MSTRRRVLLMQGSVNPPGGSQAIAAWILQALKDHHDVTLCTATPVDLPAMNKFYGTSLTPTGFRIVSVSTSLQRMLEAAPIPLALLRGALFWRRALAETPAHDVLISGSNEADFGRPGIQYIHYPWNVRPRPTVDLRWYHLGPLLRLYYRVCDDVAEFSASGSQQNLSLVNSDWTGVICRRLGLTTRTLYPPVTTTFPDVPWAARENAFICVGRIAPEKELDRVIDIVGKVRERDPAVRLHLVGSRGPRGYTRRILGRVRRHADWITLHENLPHARLVQLVARQRYGIHGMLEEHFGIAVAEMISAGCIVFVPNGGGQVEIVGRDDRVLYGTVDEAVTKIRRVMDDRAGQERLSADMAARRELFSAERFCAAMREIVAAFPAPPPSVA
jgi:glycosyltransferase involved in cell wall biosynthesis